MQGQPLLSRVAGLVEALDGLIPGSTESTPRFRDRFTRRSSLRDEPRHAHVDVEAQLVVYLRVREVATPKREPKRAADARADVERHVRPPAVR